MPEPGHGKKGSLLPLFGGGKARRKPPALRRTGSHGRRDGDHAHVHVHGQAHGHADAAADKESAPRSPTVRARDAVLSVAASERRSWNLLWLLFIASFVVCVVCLATLGRLVQQNGLANGAADAPGGGKGLFASWRDSQVVAKLQRLSQLFSPSDAAKARTAIARRALENLGDYECVGWRQTMNCTPTGEREIGNDRNCSDPVPNGVSGYCEVYNPKTGETQHVLEMFCDSLRPGVQFQCDMFQSLLSYSIKSSDYVHDANFTFERCRQDLRRANQLADTPAPVDDDGFRNESVGQLELSFERGVVFVIYEKLLLGAYVSVRSLRALGCTLPIEMWYKASETNVKHPLLQLLVDEYGVYVREIKDERATHFYTKLHAIFYSAFDQVLLLDADNFAVRDPNYLFETPEFVATGALFWPDFWKPGNTIFNIHERSFVWPFFGLEPVESFEQESGQVLIDRRRHFKALNVLMYYGFSLPRVHEELRLVWGDKDLFRFAWMKAEAPFYMAERPPGSAGTKHPDYDLFCGVTMVQHDPSGRVVFLHRNTEKLTHLNDRLLWTHIQQFKRTSDVKDYYVRGANGGKVFPQFKRCFGKDVHYEKLFTLKPMSAFPFEHLEEDLLQYAKDGAAFLKLATGDDTAADDQV